MGGGEGVREADEPRLVLMFGSPPFELAEPTTEVAAGGVAMEGAGAGVELGGEGDLERGGLLMIGEVITCIFAIEGLNGKNEIYFVEIKINGSTDVNIYCPLDMVAIIVFS